jgi:arylsulfatase A-like enzyme
MVDRPNLVVLHLESVSSAILDRFEAEFVHLRKLMDQSTTFDSFFTTAPSSIKSFCDFLHGNTSEMDDVVDWDDVTNRPAGLQENLVDTLRRDGYRVQGHGYPVIWRDDINRWELFGKPSDFRWHEDEASLHDSLARLFDGGDAPFALYLWDLRSHLSYSDDDKPPDLPGFARIRRGYQAIDSTLGWVLEALEGRGRLEDTVIVAYGDHGDELWTHGLYFGFCHAFEPYTDVIRTPAVVRDPRREARRVADVVSLVDLKPTILSLLGIDGDEPPRWDAGIDVLAETRRFAHCQSLFANQQPNKALPKCFSVTDDNYHLIASSHGLELYAYRMDPTNHCNLLSFFRYEAGELTFDNQGATHSHMRNTLNDAQREEIALRFEGLRSELCALLRRKYAPFREELRHGFDARGLLRVRPREHTWNRSHLLSDDEQREVLRETRAFLAGEGDYALLGREP